MTYTSLASLSRPLWRLLERYQLDAAFVFREAGLDPALMDSSRARYRNAGVVAAWRKAAELIKDPCFGLKAAEVWSPTDFHALGYAFLASSTLRTALKRLARYLDVIDNSIGFEADELDSRLVLRLQLLHPVVSAHAPPEEDATLAFALGLCRAAAGEQLKPLEVHLRHPKRSCKDAYVDFFRCRVRFNADSSRIVFACADLDRPLPAPNRELARHNDQILAEFLAKLRENGWIARVKRVIADELPSGTPRISLVAKGLYTSARSLRRRLAAEGTTFSQLLDAVRQELATQYIADPSRSLSEISFLLGFSELTAFSRAFKRWTGQAPTAARAALKL